MAQSEHSTRETATERRGSSEVAGQRAGPVERLDAVVALERELNARRRRRVGKLVVAVLLLGGAGLALRAYQQRKVPAPPPPFVTALVESRDLIESIESSGRLKPLNEVQVGTQVSGRVVRVHVDFNGVVKKGDLLAEIDPSLFGAQVSQAAGQLSTAQAQLLRAQASEDSLRTVLRRAQSLSAEGLTSQAELEQAQAQLAVASADAVAAKAAIRGLRAQLASANTTLAYTKIYSPIDGIVISRAVDPGQTVAASFSAPVLFVIARDLAEMQVLADVDEADVGKVGEGMGAAVRVDAFPEQSFAGTVTQIRYSPTEVQGVVTYAAVIDVKNDALKLRPGMTVTVTITTHKVKAVPAVRNAALRFKPKDVEAAGPRKELEPGQRRVYVLDPSAAAETATSAPTGDSEAPPKQKVTPQLVRVGISDGTWTELKGNELGPGTHVVIEERNSENQRKKFLGIF